MKWAAGFLCIWDQNLDGDGREVPYGKVFWKSDIDRALASENPLDLVPSWIQMDTVPEWQP